jgi:hypothetical protein
MMDGLKSGSLRPKNILILRRIRIHNTGLLTSFLFFPRHFFLYFYLLSYFLVLPSYSLFLSSFSSLSSLFCSFLLLFFLSSLSSSYLFSLPYFHIVMFPSLIKNRHVAAHCNLFAVCLGWRMAATITSWSWPTTALSARSWSVTVRPTPSSSPIISGTPDKLQYRIDSAPSRDPNLLSLLSRTAKLREICQFLVFANYWFCFFLLNCLRQFLIF